MSREIILQGPKHSFVQTIWSLRGQNFDTDLLTCMKLASPF